LFAPRPAVAYVTDLTNNPHIGGQKVFVGENAPRGTAINYYLKGAANDVKLSIVDGQASEPGSNTGKWRVTRTGSTASALVVDYAMSGTASRTSLISVPFPPPEGELIMIRRPFIIRHSALVRGFSQFHF